MLLLLRWFGLSKGLIIGLLSFLLVSVSTKVATRATVLGLLVIFFIGVMGLLTTVINGIAVVAPDAFNVAYSWIIPNNFVPCVTAIFTVQVAIWVWRWKKYAVDFVSGGVS